MKIRDSHATINGDNTEFHAPSGGIEIIAEDGRTMFGVNLAGNTLEITSGHVCKHNGKLLDDRFSIEPVASNLFVVTKKVYTD